MFFFLKSLLLFRHPDAFEREAVEVPYPHGFLGKAVISALQATGFTRKRGDSATHYFKPCSLGTFSNSSSQGAEGCIPCPPGILH